MAARSLEGTVESPLSARQVVIWLDEAWAADADFAARLIGPAAQRMMEPTTTLAIVGRSEAGFVLRGVRRSAFLARCSRRFDREGMQRLLDVAS